MCNISVPKILYGTYISAFDRVSPEIVIAIWRMLDVPGSVLRSIEELWTEQKRYTEFAGHVAYQQVDVHASLPQGDPASMLALVTLLLAPTLLIMEEVPTLQITSYADDRNGFSKNREDIDKANTIWKEFEENTAMRNSSEKEQRWQIFADGPQKQEKIRDSSDTKILGLEAQVAQRDTTKRERTALEVAMGRSHRVQALPVGTLDKRIVNAGLVTSKATWPRVVKALTPEEVKTFRVRNREAICSGRWTCGDLYLLTLLVVGHSNDPLYRAIHHGIQFVKKVTDKDKVEKILESGKETCGPIGTLKAHLAQLGLQYDKGLTWRKEDEVINLKDLMQYDGTSKILHQLRHLWRASLWSLWKNKGTRNDTKLLRTEEERLGTTALFDDWQHKLALNAIKGPLAPWVIGILSGAHVSDAKLQRMQDVSRGKLAKCTYCEAEVSSLDHEIWFCPRNREQRGGCLPPLSPFTRRMGWSISPIKDKEEAFEFTRRLECMASVRRAVLQDRYSLVWSSGVCEEVVL